MVRGFTEFSSPRSSLRSHNSELEIVEEVIYQFEMPGVENLHLLEMEAEMFL